MNNRIIPLQEIETINGDFFTLNFNNGHDSKQVGTHREDSIVSEDYYRASVEKFYADIEKARENLNKSQTSPSAKEDKIN
jgi:hypothetical protein